MHRHLHLILALISVLSLPQVVAAQEARRPGPPDTEVLFNRLDKNHDGVITPDEIPPGAPQRIIDLLKQADTNGDQKVTLDQLRQAIEQRRQAQRAAGPDAGDPKPYGGPGPWRRPGPQAGPGPDDGFGPGPGGFRRGGPAWSGGPPRGPLGGPGREAGEFAGRGPGRPAGPPQGPFAKLFDLKALFDGMDKNKDGKLSFEEFSEGMKELHRDMMSPQQPGRGMAWGQSSQGRMGWGRGPQGPMGWGGGPRGPMAWGRGPQGPMAQGRGPQGPGPESLRWWTEQPRRLWEDGQSMAEGFHRHAQQFLARQWHDWGPPERSLQQFQQRVHGWMIHQQHALATAVKAGEARFATLEGKVKDLEARLAALEAAQKAAAK